MDNYYSDQVYQHILDPTLPNAPQPYRNQVPRLYISTPEQPESWNASQRPRSVQDTRNYVYSPAASVHTSQTTPDTLISDRGVYRQPDFSRTTNRTNFSQQNSPFMLSPGYVSPTFNPSAREEPWSSLHMRNAENRRARCPSRPSNAELPQYQYPRVGSDIDSSALASDSGYMSFGTSQSVLGNEHDRAAQPLTTEFVNRMGSMNVESVAGSVTAGSHVPSDQRSHVGSTRSRKSISTPIKCDHAGCKETFRYNSEYKKHKRKHDKPYRCEEPDCKRDEGFTTRNDLDRHKKSVHQIDVHNKSYKCAGKNCRNKEKVWPRLDNFKQHVRQMHANEELDDVIERSRLYSEKQPSFVDDESAVAHMGASLVLEGMDKSLPSYPVMASSSPLEPPLKQDQQDHSLFDWSSDAMKEEHKKPRSPDETSSVTHSAHTERHRTQRRAPGLSSANHTHIPSPSDISMDPPPMKAISQAPPSSIDYGLSNAPQTKAEQQRMARKRSVAAPSPTGSTDIGHILSLLQQANDPMQQDNKSAGKSPSIPSNSDTVTLSKSEALEIVKFIKAAQAPPHRTGKEIALSQRICPHAECDHIFTRACDMRKHLKRHEKPYGCTYPKCYKRFGAKSDWKRHENNQHFQPEAFRCAFKTSTGTVCGVHSFRVEMFQDHLKVHGITSSRNSSRISEDLIKRSKIGKNCQVTFWCGLCKAIIPLKTRRNAAWDERFDHIAYHLEKEKKRIEEWICVEQNRTKKELEEEKKRDARGVEDDKDKDDESESVGEDEDAEDALPQAPAVPPQAPLSWTIPQPPPPSFSPESSRKREAPSDINHTDQQSKQKRRRTYMSTYCCTCENGPCGSMQGSCLDCGHVLCGNCPVFGEEFMMNGAMELYE